MLSSVTSEHLTSQTEPVIIRSWNNLVSASEQIK